jgi:GNAT superfamily N-acetyltransferase
MSGSSDTQLLQRLVDFQLDLQRDSSEQVDEFEWGRLIYNPATAAMWSDSFLEVESGDIDADRLVTLADELLGGRGMEHRSVVPRDPQNGERLEPRFRELGWDVSRNLYMVLRRPPDRQGSPAAEVTRDEVAAVQRAVAEVDPDYTSDAVEQSPLRRARRDPIGNGRWFAAPADGEPGASCVLYERAGIGQVETVETRPEDRGRGLARAVVLAASDASRRAGHELTFIIADADDWPWKLYQRLGFDPIGETSEFLRKPPQLSGESP